MTQTMTTTRKQQQTTSRLLLTLFTPYSLLAYLTQEARSGKRVCVIRDFTRARAVQDVRAESLVSVASQCVAKILASEADSSDERKSEVATLCAKAIVEIERLVAGGALCEN